MADRCRPQKCGLPCKISCPVNKIDKKCIVVDTKSKRAEISEQLCIGCNICVKKCQFNAIHIENLPSALDSQVSFRYGPNSFKLHRLPSPRPGQVLGLVGENGTGKSTALQIMKGDLHPNFGDFTQELKTEEIIRRYRGTELQQYFSRLYKEELTVGLKIQYVDAIVKTKNADKTVSQLVRKYAEKRPEQYEYMLGRLGMGPLLERQVNQLSGGEIQRFSLLYTLLRGSDVTLVDEPSSYLDVRQRMASSEVIRAVVEGADGAGRYVVVVEHDLAVLDYMSDSVSVLYGQPGVYGIITLPYSCREGINIFLRGFIPTENMRFRREELRFHVQQTGAAGDGAEDADAGRQAPAELNRYPAMTVRQGGFTLRVRPGRFCSGQITLLLGENGTGKTTFIRTVAGARQCAPQFERPGDELPRLAVSLKPQTLSPAFDGTVAELFAQKIPAAVADPAFQNAVVQRLSVGHLLDRAVRQLSGGELQRVATILALGKNASVYLIDEPSAYLDATQRLVVAKVIKRHILSTNRCGYIVEHDFLMTLYLADQVIVFEGQPGVECTANEPESLSSGMNRFLSFVGVTFRRDAQTLRPRVNKPGSAKDKDQKIQNLYFADFMDDDA